MISLTIFLDSSSVNTDYNYTPFISYDLASLVPTLFIMDATSHMLM